MFFKNLANLIAGAFESAGVATGAGAQTLNEVNVKLAVATGQEIQLVDGRFLPGIQEIGEILARVEAELKKENADVVAAKAAEAKALSDAQTAKNIYNAHWLILLHPMLKRPRMRRVIKP